MNTEINSTFKYKIGGSLYADAPCYVERQADDDLYNELKMEQFCYVFNSRQVGKSSLRVRTMKKLEAEGIKCASIDLSIFGKDILTFESWCKIIFIELVKQFGLSGKVNRKVWWEEQYFLSPVKRLNTFFEEIILKEIHQNIVIFIDEIDTVLSLNFLVDDFFAWIRSCYNQRVDNIDYNRMTFCLLGVATPSELIQDTRRTPFNIGKAIELSGFTLEEAQPLTRGLVNKADNPQAVLESILYWTGGQPFLTQKLCYLVANSKDKILATEENKQIEKLVQSCIIQNWESQDEPEHLRTIINRLLKDEKITIALLGLYRKILRRELILEKDILKESSELRLSGLVVKKHGNLKIYNPIYEQIFNDGFVSEKLDSLRPYAEKLRSWLKFNKKDNSQLLSRKELKKCLKWAEERSLTDDDRQFLNASETKDIIRKKWRDIYIILSSLLIIFISLSYPLYQKYLAFSQCPKGYLRATDFDVSTPESFCYKAFSQGENVLFTDELNIYLEKGVEKFKEGKYQESINLFKKAIEASPENPEPQIYLNNARVRLREQEMGVTSFRIAVVTPVNYKVEVAKALLRGVADAQTQFNDRQNKNNESLLEIMIANDYNNVDPKKSREIANQLSKFSQEKDPKLKLIAVIGHYSSESTEAALPEYTKVGLPLISPTSASTDLRSPIFFRIVPNNQVAGEVLAKYAQAQNIDKLAIFYDSESTFSNTLKNFFVKSLKATKIEFVDIRSFNIDFDKKIDNLANNKKVNTIVLFPSTETTSVSIAIARAIDNLFQEKRLKFKLLGGTTLSNPKVINQDPEAFNGLLLAIPWHPDEWRDLNSYAQKAKKRWGFEEGIVNWRTAMGYDATQVIIKAIESLQKQSKEVTSQTLRETITSICLEHTETSGDALWFDKDGNSNRDNRLVQWVNDKDKGWTFKLLKKPSPSTHQSCPKP